MATSSDYIPRADGDFDAWLQNLVGNVTTNTAALGLTAADITPVQDAVTDWQTKYAANTTAQAAAQSARQAKDDSRAATEGIVRSLVGKLQASPNVTDAQRQSLAITVRSATRTATGAPTSKPLAQVDISQRLRHIISFLDELTPTSRAKPDGVQGCEIWIFIGANAPTGPNDFRYLATDTRSPYLVEFDAADAGKTAYYLLRWISTRGETGPWSQTFSGTITN
ncbi:MAG: hypothetical protein QOC96_3102 [Acidobacteriota bacterium]|jgi:hypothetical protein|nr:hypothetical protein [Acidobacteriota bacterium]